MKINYIKISILFLGLVSLLSSCDKVEKGENDNYLVELGDLDWQGKYVILEDYTGHNCNNCPNAAIVADGLKGIYKEKLIVVAVHAPDGYFTRPYPMLYPEDFRTTEGSMWAKEFGISALPQGMVNRHTFNGKRVLERDQWGTDVAKEMWAKPLLNLNVALSYNESTKEVQVKGMAKFLNDISIDMRIGAMLLQDSIIGAQLLPSGTRDTSYVFKHVLRQTFDGAWGKSFVKATDGYKTGDSLAYNLTFTLQDAYTGIPVVPKHCHVVLYVSTDEPTKTGAAYEFLQAAEVPLIKKQESKK